MRRAMAKQSGGKTKVGEAGCEWRSRHELRSGGQVRGGGGATKSGSANGKVGAAGARPGEVGCEWQSREIRGIIVGVRAFIWVESRRRMGIDRVPSSCNPLFMTTPSPTLISLCIRFHWRCVSVSFLSRLLISSLPSVCYLVVYSYPLALCIHFHWRSCSAALLNFFSCCAFGRWPESTHSGGSQRKPELTSWGKLCP
jgi:hypothetical protein